MCGFVNFSTTLYTSMIGIKRPDATPDNYYDILEVSPRARPEVIEAAYRTLMKSYHPDKGNDGRVALELNEAKEVLLDQKRRKEYDSSRLNLEGKLIGNYRVLEQIAEGGFWQDVSRRARPAQNARMYQVWP